MRWHYQNLNEKHYGPKKVLGSVLVYGRMWWHFGDKEAHRDRGTIRFEWHLKPAFGASIEFDTDDDNEITLSLSPFFGSFYLAFVGMFFPRWMRNLLLPYEDKTHDGKVYRHWERRETHARWFGDSLQVCIWKDDNEWSSKDPKWRSFSVRPLDILFGATKHTDEILVAEHDTLIPMPEGQYPARVKLERDTWKRKRWPWWPFVSNRVSYQFDIPDGIPFSGKGENSWDCGEDGLFGTGVTASNEGEAVGKIATLALRERYRRDGHEATMKPWPENPLERSKRFRKLREENARKNQSASTER